LTAIQSGETTETTLNFYSIPLYNNFYHIYCNVNYRVGATQGFRKTVQDKTVIKHFAKQLDKQLLSDCDCLITIIARRYL